MQKLKKDLVDHELGFTADKPEVCTMKQDVRLSGFQSLPPIKLNHHGN